jgi:hypothetical protein
VDVLNWRVPYRRLQKLLYERRAWRNGLNRPVFIPREHDEIRGLLAEARLVEASQALSHRAKLGSGSAAAILDYLTLGGLQRFVSEGADISSRCLHAASHGDRYAQYVVACRYLQQGDQAAARDWLLRSAQQMFPPALCDVGRNFGSGVDGLPVRPDIAWDYLWASVRRGHTFSLISLVRYGLKGLFGPMWRVMAVVSFPIVILTALLLYHFSPFEVRFFIYNAADRDPLFSPTGGVERN